MPSTIKSIDNTKNLGVKNIATSFVGDYRKNITRGDRKELVEFLKKTTQMIHIFVLIKKNIIRKVS